MEVTNITRIARTKILDGHFLKNSRVFGEILGDWLPEYNQVGVRCMNLFPMICEWIELFD